MPDPKKNTAFTFALSLVETAARPNFKANPTLATGDFKVSIDGGAFNNLATLPTVSPASGRNVQVALSAAEMNGDRIVVQAVDAAGAEWDEVMAVILTTVSTTDEIKTETASIQADTNDLQTRLPAALVSGRMSSDLGSINGATGGVDGLDRSTRTIVLGTATTGGTTTSIPTSSLSPAATVADQFKNRVVIFAEDTTTAALRGQAAAITASTSGGTLTVSTLTTAPASGDTFAIL